MPILMPSTPSYFAARTRASRWSTPWLLKPMRLMMASAWGRRNRRGLGLPGCGRGVTVPISTKPKPSWAKPSMAAPFLSRPAASPTGFGKSRPMTFTGVFAGALHSKPLSPRRPPAPIRSRDRSWEVSGESLNNS
ncbi:hypothetical protein D9M73_228360 [compost metagenome]